MMTMDEQTNNRWWWTALNGPVTWFIYFMLVYMIADLGCQAGWGQVLVMGFNLVELLVVLSTIIAVLVTLLGVWMSYRDWHTVREISRGDSPIDRLLERRQFIAFSGMIMSILFTFAILVTAVPVGFLSACGGLGV